MTTICIFFIYIYTTLILKAFMTKQIITLADTNKKIIEENKEFINNTLFEYLDNIQDESKNSLLEKLNNNVDYKEYFITQMNNIILILTLFAQVSRSPDFNLDTDNLIEQFINGSINDDENITMMIYFYCDNFASELFSLNESEEIKNFNELKSKLLENYINFS